MHDAIVFTFSVFTDGGTSEGLQLFRCLAPCVDRPITRISVGSVLQSKPDMFVQIQRGSFALSGSTAARIPPHCGGARARWGEVQSGVVLWKRILICPRVLSSAFCTFRMKPSIPLRELFATKRFSRVDPVGLSVRDVNRGTRAKCEVGSLISVCQFGNVHSPSFDPSGLKPQNRGKNGTCCSFGNCDGSRMPSALARGSRPALLQRIPSHDRPAMRRETNLVLSDDRFARI
jgi:hypothetical protein